MISINATFKKALEWKLTDREARPADCEAAAASASAAAAATAAITVPSFLELRVCRVDLVSRLGEVTIASRCIDAEAWPIRAKVKKQNLSVE